MVFFTCSHCGESVKKPSVAKHYQTKCRKNEPFLTCVDCLKDFRGTEYEAHTKCVTEDERYSAKGYVPKPSQNKGEKKQQVWQECIQAVVKKSTLKPDERDLIRAISKYENVPRKKTKFVNFLSNAFKHYANKTELIDRVWTEMESVFKDISGFANEEQTQPAEKSEDSQNNSEKKLSQMEGNGVKKEKKRKRQAEEEKANETLESEKTDEKVKKKKQKSNEANSAEGNSDTSVSETDNKQEKKNRKRKAGDNCQTEQPDSVTDEAEPGKKKKKKKHDKVAESQINETPAETPQKESKKKGKNKKLEADKMEVAETPTAVTNGNETTKKEKKAKKTENKENCEDKGEVRGETDKPVPKKKSKGEAEEKDKKQETFDWKATILNVLNQDGKNKKIQLQKLQKKVLKLHCKILNCESSPKKEKKFMKKLKEMPQIEIDDNFVVLKA